MPALVHKGILKGYSMSPEEGKKRFALGPAYRKEKAAEMAIIPGELSKCVCDYAERLLEDGVGAERR